MTNIYKNDPFYRLAYDEFKSHSLMTKAGWINENRSKEDIDSFFNLNFLTTGFENLNIKKNTRNKVLLTTGSFAPLHEGHLHIMAEARNMLRKEGLHVAGGYISPSHDKYVLNKNGGSINLTSQERIGIINGFIKDIDWLSIDPWESLYNDIPVNFTSVIMRLESYLRKHIDCSIDVVYVFGSDNIDFSYSFVGKGEFVCVNRENNLDKLLNSSWFDKKRMHVSKSKPILMSSTEIRKSGNKICKRKDISKSGNYFIRDDSVVSNNFLKGCEVIDEITYIFKKYISNDVVTIDVEKQIDTIKSMNIKYPILSLDTYLKGDINLGISRLFDISSPQYKPRNFVTRSFNEINIDTKNIKEVVLIDDDTASGATMKYVSDFLNKNKIEVADRLFLNEIVIDKNTEVFDIVDARDFILGANFGGLCVQLPNGMIGRTIYTLPYVNLSTRASIPYTNHLEFSMDIWEMNLNFFKNLDIKVSDVCYLTQNWLKYIGFNDKTLLKDVCLWHIIKLRSAL